MDNSSVPTKGNLIKAKKSYKLSKLGYELMDKKRNILIREMMALIEAAKDIQSRIDETFSKAYKALQAANISLGVCNDIARAVPIDDTLKIQYRSVMGVEIPTVKSVQEAVENVHYGFDSTNSMLDIAYLNFLEVKRLSMLMAEMETSVYRLAVSVSKAQKRANALKNIILPRNIKRIFDITNALEEKDREEFSRSKVIKANKIKEEQIGRAHV